MSQQTNETLERLAAHVDEYTRLLLQKGLPESLVCDLVVGFQARLLDFVELPRFVLDVKMFWRMGEEGGEDAVQESGAE